MSIALKENENKTESTPKDIRELEQEARNHMFQNGFIYNEAFDTSGEQVKFNGRDGDGKEKTEWYRAHSQTDINGIASLQITYNSHHDSIKGNKNYTYHSKTSKPLSVEDHEAQKKRVQKLQEQRKQNENKEREKREGQALQDRERFDKAAEAGHSPYLNRKQVGAHGVRFEANLLLIPMRDRAGEVQALQEIHPSKKLFPKESKPRDKHFTNSTKGLYHTLGELKDGEPIRISEGYATAASVYESTGCKIPHVIAFSVGQYKHVLPILKELYPNSPITICADNNNSRENPMKNAGLKEAFKVAQEFKCDVKYPTFPEGEQYDNADFNDLMILQGRDSVSKQLNQTHEDFKIDDSTETEEEDFDIEGDDKEVIKARVYARSLALSQADYKMIVEGTTKKFPKLKSQVASLAKKAIAWAEKNKKDCNVTVGGIPKRITDMESLNSRFAQLEAPYQPCILINRKDTQAIAEKDFYSRLSGEVVVSGVTKQGGANYIDASKFWKGNTNKTIYRKIAFTSQPVSEDTYNLFTGFGIVPKKGTCERILNHIEEVICAGNKENSVAFIKKLAWELQNIGKPSRIVTMLKSEQQQTGKGAFLEGILLPIYGNAGFKTHDLGQVIGRFNDAIRGKSFIFLDEALFAGDLKSADAIKSLSTANSTPIEQKHVSVVNVPIGINFYLTTNHENGAHIEENCKRYWILEVNPNRCGDTEYFNELFNEINNGGLEAFLDYLLGLDIKDFVPWRDVPLDNEFKDEMIQNSINPYDARKWLEECCHEGSIIGSKDEDGFFDSEIWQEGLKRPNQVFSAAYREWQKTVKSPVAPRPTPANKFGQLLKDAGLELFIQDGVRLRKLPSTETCLENITKMTKKGSKKG